MLKKIAAIILSVLMLCACLTACGGGTTLEDVKKAGKLTIATSPDFPPFESLDANGSVDGIEIEIDTRQDYRRRGLASACAAKLILACLDRDLYPSWDAHTEISVALAEKLGYHMDHPYVTYAINGY